MNRKALTVSILLLSTTLLAQKPAITVSGDKDQTAGTNNGNMIQVNVYVERSLKARAKKDLGDEHSWYGLLTPAKENAPTTQCHYDAGSLVVILGGGLTGACAATGCTVLRDDTGMHSRDFLSFSRKGGSLMVQGLILDEDGRVLVDAQNGRFNFNNNNIFYWKRPDGHTLTVRDQKDRDALNIHFLNKTTIYVEGIFYGQDKNGVEIDKKKLLVLANDRRVVRISECTANVTGSEGSIFTLERNMFPTEGTVGKETAATSHIGANQPMVSRGSDFPSYLPESPASAIGLYKEIGYYRNRVTDLDFQWKGTISRIGQQFIAPYKYGGATGAIPDRLPDDLIDRLESDDESSTASYVIQSDKIQDLRRRVLAYMGSGLTPNQIREDEEMFTQANRAARGRIPGSKLSDPHINSGKYQLIVAYLDKLQRQIGEFH